MDKLGNSLLFKGFRKTLMGQFGEEPAARIWQEANENLRELKGRYPDIAGDSKMLILPAAALYLSLQKYAPEQALPLLCAYGTRLGQKIARVIHAVTSVPGVSKGLWKHMPGLMRKTSSPKAGYTRRIVSETHELVGVDILSCPLHDAAVRIGVPEAARMVCAMDKAYMTGFKYIRYSRTASVAEGGPCCDYRLTFDREKQ